jgi:hypothetical protein
MFNSPYQTTPCKGYKLDPIVNAVMGERIEGNLITLRDQIELVSPASPNVPAFTQLLTKYEFADRRDKPQIVVDARSLLRLNRGGDDPYTVSNYSEMELQETRAAIQLFWQSENNSRTDLLRTGDLPAVAFINWISRSISGKLGLDPEQQMEITIITAYYYSNLFYCAEEFDDNTKLKIAQSIARWTRIPAEKVLDITDNIGYLANIVDYIAAVRANVHTTRIEHLELGFLYAMLGGSWFGSGSSRETVCVALEHPPTFLALILASLNSRSYRNATLAKVVLMAVKGGNDRDFIRGITAIVPKTN